MTDEQNETPVVDESPLEQSWTERISVFLNTTEPAKLLMWSALGIFLAAVCTYFGIQMQYGLSGSSMSGLWQAGEHYAPIDPNGGRSPLPPTIGQDLGELWICIWNRWDTSSHVDGRAVDL